MRLSLNVLALRLSLLVSLAASAVLLVDYRHAGDPAFCGRGTGCMAVRLSPLSALQLGTLRIPLPVVGMVAFGALFFASLAARRRLHLLVLAALTGLGGLVAVCLLATQAFVVQAFCKWCVTVDLCAIVAALAAARLVLLLQRPDGARVEGFLEALVARVPVGLAWVLAAALGVGLPFVWAQYPVLLPLPAEVAAVQQPGMVNIVEFADFECPYCRLFHAVLEDVLKEGHRVHFVRKMMPLGGHPGAMPAALAYECVPERMQEAMAGLLYEAPVEELTADGTLKLAETLGVKRNVAKLCAGSPDTLARVKEDMAAFDHAGGPGLPLTYVNQRVLVGFSDHDRLLEAVHAEETGPHPALPVAWMLALLAAAFAATTALTARLAPPEPPATAREPKRSETPETAV